MVPRTGRSSLQPTELELPGDGAGGGDRTAVRSTPALRWPDSTAYAGGCGVATQQPRCPELVVVDHDRDRDVIAFEAVLSLIEQTSSTVMPIRPGLCALNAPARFFGGEQRGAAVIAETLVTRRDLGLPDRDRRRDLHRRAGGQVGRPPRTA